jgi:hypothetical protein
MRPFAIAAIAMGTSVLVCAGCNWREDSAPLASRGAYRGRPATTRRRSSVPRNRWRGFSSIRRDLPGRRIKVG